MSSYWGTTGPSSCYGGLGDHQLPYEQQVEPIHGWKLATLIIHDGQLSLRGYTVHVAYKPDDQAICNNTNAYPCGGIQHEHTSPAVGCSCGFYLMQTLETMLAINLMNEKGVVLEVEAYGTLIQHERGWRAQHQRVLAIWLDPLCRARGCRSNAKYVHVDIHGNRSECGQQLGGDMYTPADIANQLGVETRWAA